MVQEEGGKTSRRRRRREFDRVRDLPCCKCSIYDSGGTSQFVQSAASPTCCSSEANSTSPRHLSSSLLVSVDPPLLPPPSQRRTDTVSDSSSRHPRLPYRPPPVRQLFEPPSRNLRRHRPRIPRAVADVPGHPEAPTRHPTTSRPGHRPSPLLLPAPLPSPDRIRERWLPATGSSS